jgi:hypothetical protein
VKGLAAGGQAEGAGILDGWRVIRLEGAPVGTFDEFAAGLAELKAQKVGSVKISWWSFYGSGSSPPPPIPA